MVEWVVRCDPPGVVRVVADRVYVDDGVLRFVERNRDWCEGDDVWLTVCVFGRDEWLRVERASDVGPGDVTFGERRLVEG